MPDAEGTVAESEKLFGEKKAKKAVKTLNGVSVDLTVAVTEIEGDITIDGDIPENALVVVKKGGIKVNGFVGGNIVAEKDITIAGNIGGGVIMSPRGSIRAERALSGSRILSFRNDVTLDSGESPACIFAWNTFTVSGDLLGGRVLARSAQIRGSASGCELHLSAASRIAALRKTDRSDTDIFLRRQISCDEYGRAMTPDETKMLRGMGRHSYANSIMAGMRKYAEKNIRDSYTTFLYMLLCNTLDAQAMSSVRGLQAQSNLLEELIGIMDLMSGFMLSAAKSGDQSPAELEGIAESSLTSLATVSEDLTTMSSVFRVTHKSLIAGTSDMLARIAQAIRRNESNRTIITKWLQDIASRRRECSETREDIDENLQRMVANLGLDPAVAKSVEANPAKLEAMLDTLKKKLSSDPSNARAVRLRSPLARLLTNTIDRNQKQIDNWGKQVSASQEALDSLKQSLTANATVIFASEDSGTLHIDTDEVEIGVVFYADPRDGANPVGTAASHVVINNPIDAPTRFVLHGSEIQRRVPQEKSAEPEA